MADATMHHQVLFNRATIMSHLKSIFTKKYVVFAYRFVFALIVFTFLLAFDSSLNSSSSSPRFFSNFSTSISSYYFFSNSSMHSRVWSEISLQNNATRFQNTTLFDQAPDLDKEVPSAVKNGTLYYDELDSYGMFHINVTTSEPPKVSMEVKNKTLYNDFLGKGGIFNPNSTTIQPPKAQNQDLHSQFEGFKAKITRIVAPISPVEAKNQIENNDLNENIIILDSNQTTIEAPVVTNQTVDSASSVKGKDIIENVTNLSSSLFENQMNQPASDVPTKADTEKLVESLMNCDLFDGEWVRDDSYPLYKAGTCPVIDHQFDCFLHGRPDNGFQQYKWKPKNCTLPRLNGSHMLELLRGKRLVFVGDSLNRNMWESLVCILRNSLEDQSKNYQAYDDRRISIFKDYNCTVEFYVSPFLVQEWSSRVKGRSKQETLRLDKMGTSAKKYRSADIIVFNTGHWWTHPKTSEGKDYYQEGVHVYHQLDVLEAFRKALTTWARWVDTNINPSKTLVFFRGYSATHFRCGQWNSGGQCDHQTEPIKNETYLSGYPPMMIVLEKVLTEMKTPVTYLNITRLTDYREDGHPSIYRKHSRDKTSTVKFQDCSHWCLPGVPDAWNELLYAELWVKQYQNQQQQQKESFYIEQNTV